MKIRPLLVLCGIISSLLLSFEMNAQSIPASVKREIGSQLSCEERNKDIVATKIGPAKNGYVAQCGGGGEAVVFEKTPQGIKKIFESETQMNGSIGLGKKAYLGYYEIYVEAHGSWYWYESTYRWNGNRFVMNRSRSRECEITPQGELRNCKYS